MKPLVLGLLLLLAWPATVHAVSCANIRAAVRSGYSPAAVAHRFHVSRQTVNYCLSRRHPYHRRCCRICYPAYYACGNVCISRHQRCRQPPGCACNG